ncbi:MAG: ComEC/Rec2 family competence protein [Planctomycetota bacterium]
MDDCGEDPLRERAWLRGRDARGTGLLCLWPGALPDGVADGARVIVTGRVHRTRPPRNPGAFDAQAADHARGVQLRLYLRDARNVEVEDAAATPWTRSLRRAGVQRMRSALAPADAGIGVALLFGARGGVAPADRLRFERSGTLHLLAISGLHLLLLAGAVHRVARMLGGGPRLAAAITLMVCLAYVPIAGAGAPVRRAAAVLTFYAVALVRGRTPDPASALGGAALLLVVTDPEEVARVGFWLSFTAAAGISLLAPPWHRRWSERHRLLARFPAVREDRLVRLAVERHLLATVPVAIAAWLATAPLVAHQFGLVTPWAPLTNLFAAPFVALLMPLLAIVAAGGAFVAPFVAWLLELLRAGLDLADRLPGACLSVLPPTIAAITLWYAALLVVRWRAAIGVTLLVVAGAIAWPAPGAAPARMVVLDVGHGQALLLLDGRGGAVLVDAGSRSQRQIARRTLRPALRALGVRRLDAVICTHGDRDHWSGVEMLLGRLPIDRLIVGPHRPRALERAATARGVTVVPASNGDLLWQSGEIRLQVLDDGRKPARRSGNDRSLVLVARLGAIEVLLPADRESRGVDDLLRHPLPRAPILLAPHHGGPNDAAATLGSRTGAQLLIVSTGPGFARDATLTAYGTRHVRRTDRHGAVLLELRPDGAVEVTTLDPDVPTPPVTIRPP